MIKSDFGNMTAQGNNALLATEFMTIVKGLYVREVFSKEKLEELFRDAFRSDEEIDKEFKETFKDGISVDEFENIIKKLSETRESGIVKESKEKPEVETILDDEDVKIVKTSFNPNGKSKDEIAEILKEILGKGTKTDDI